MKILIIGAKGMLGQELVKLYQQDDSDEYEIIAWDKDDIDVRDFDNLKNKINEVWPNVIYNAVAYNAVDSCEDDDEEYDKAKILNTELPGELAKIAKSLEATLVHYSSDYVFDGERPKYKNGKRTLHCCGSGCDRCQYQRQEETVFYWQYMEGDQPNPLNRYGWTKYKGEQAVEEIGGKYYIIRLSKLFGLPGGGKRAFFDVMLEKGKTEKEVKVIDGELSKFTYVPDLAQESKNIVEENEPIGIYHIVNESAVTWYESVKTLYKLAELETKVTPIDGVEFNRPAKRADSTVLKNMKRKPLRSYEEALREFLKE